MTQDEKDPTPFQEFPKMARLSRPVIVTEKIDGTNASVCITDDGRLRIGSRTRWITPEDDNYGFARWVMERESEIRTLGPGRHFGEWWGSGINRGYDLPKGEKRWSLFNTARWCLHDQTPERIPTADPRIERYQERLPACCGLVPIIHQGVFDTHLCIGAMERLKQLGSLAAPGFMKPEGIVVFHVAGNIGFKKTIEHDEVPKALAPT